MTDRLIGGTAVLALLVAATLWSEHSTARVTLDRALWNCAKTHDETEIHYEPSPSGGQVQRFVTTPVCDNWVRR